MKSCYKAFQRNVFRVTPNVPVMLWLLLATTIVAHPVLAAWQVRAEVMDHRTDPSSTYTQQIIVQERMLRISTDKVTHRPEPDALIFRGDEEVLWSVQHDRRRVRELRAAQFAELGSQMQDARSKLEKQLADAKPEHRAMLERMMQKMGVPSGSAQPAAPGTTVRPTSDTETIEGYRCRKVELRVEGEKVGEAWVADSVPGGDEVLAGLKGLQRFHARILDALGAAPRFSGSREPPLWEEGELNGYPFRLLRFRGGRVVEEVRIAPPRAADVDEALFRPPEGYEIVNPASGR